MALAASAVAGGAAVAAYLNGKYHISQDLTTISRQKQAEKDYQKRLKQNRISPWYIFAENAKKYSSNRAIWSRNGCYTFGELHDQSARYAQWLLEQGIRPGDLVAVYLFNSPEFIMLWFAMLCIGAAPAFMNYNLEGRALSHCMSVCESKVLIVEHDPNCIRRVEGNRAELEGKGTNIVVLDKKLQNEIASQPAIVPGDEYRAGVKPTFPYTLIYTSGTTGLPKGCQFTTSRLILLGTHLNRTFQDKPSVDCWYCPMPLYHGTGSITTSCALLSGIGVAIPPRFSVSGFWPDIHDSGATWFIYVGETARYLLNAPPHPLERAHKLRGAYGNGLRPDIWEKFQTRFNIPEIGEFFNSSEGMFSLVNWDRGPYRAGTVGQHGIIWRRRLKDIYVPLKIDHDTGDIWRDPKTGFAKRMPYEEGGEIVVKVPSKEAFGGYWRNEAATNKKFASSVFKKGDLYYRTGDALRRTSEGKWFFMDRLGDTFRWKSENVSTAEVSECMGRYPGVAEANVYGVLVPNHEGRAGCAALHIEEATFPKTAVGTPDYDALLKYTQERLPRYAVPIFLRVVKASTHIHNHKQNKVPLRKEGVDPKLIGTEVPSGREDIFLWLPQGAKSYVPFMASDWQDLETLKAKL